MNLPWALGTSAARRPVGYLTDPTCHPTFLCELIWDLLLAGLSLSDLRGNLRIDPSEHFLGLRLNTYVAGTLTIAGIAGLFTFRADDAYICVGTARTTEPSVHIQDLGSREGPHTPPCEHLWCKMDVVVATHARTETLGAEQPERPRASEKRLAVAAVAAQVALLTAQAVLNRRHDWPTPAPVKVGAGTVALIGAAVLATASSSLGRGLTASPLPNSHSELRTDGLYRHVRHPIYAGVIAISWARTAASGDRRQAALDRKSVV